MNQPGPTYNEQMNAWAEIGNKKRNIFARILIPDPELPMSKRLIGFILRLVLFVGLPLFLLSRFLEASFSHPATERAVAADLKEYMGAESVSIEGMEWRGDGVACEKITIEGTDHQSFKSIIVRQVHLRMKSLERLNKPWPITHATASSADIVMSGAEPFPLPDSEKRKGAEIFTGGFSFQPTFSEIPLRSINADLVNIRWGGSKHTEGELTSAKVAMTLERDKRWLIKIREGNLSQNWLQDATLTEAEAYWNGSELSMEAGALKFRDNGVGTLDFAFYPRDGLAFEATANIEKVDLRHLIEGGYRGYFGGQVSGTVSFSGHLTSEPLQGIADLQPVKMTVGNIPLFEKIGEISLNQNLKNLPIREGNIHIEAKGGDAQKLEFNLIAPDLAEVKGSASLLNHHISGKASMGIERYVFRRIEDLKDKHFSREEDDKHWMDFPIEGKINAPTPDAFAKLEADFPAQ